ANSKRRIQTGEFKPSTRSGELSLPSRGANSALGTLKGQTIGARSMQLSGASRAYCGRGGWQRFLFVVKQCVIDLIRKRFVSRDRLGAPSLLRRCVADKWRRRVWLDVAGGFQSASGHLRHKHGDVVFASAVVGNRNQGLTSFLQ